MIIMNVVRAVTAFRVLRVVEAIRFVMFSRIFIKTVRE